MSAGGGGGDFGCLLVPVGNFYSDFQSKTSYYWMLVNGWMGGEKKNLWHWAKSIIYFIFQIHFAVRIMT